MYVNPRSGLNTINDFGDYNLIDTINSFLKFYVSPTRQYLFGKTHVKVGCIPPQKIYVMLKLEELVMNYTFTMCTTCLYNIHGDKIILYMIPAFNYFMIYLCLLTWQRATTFNAFGKMPKSVRNFCMWKLNQRYSIKTHGKPK